MIFKFETQKEKKQNHRQKCENDEAVHNQNDSFGISREFKYNEGCLFSMQQHN